MSQEPPHDGAASGPKPRAPSEPDAPEALPIVDPANYTILGEFAKGGFGRLLRARDRRLNREVALKELFRETEEAEERFVREALVIARLQHPSIVPIHEVGRWPT